jgi:hypothetical protein
MSTPLRVEAAVLPGHWIEIATPELPEGARVQLTVALAPQPPSRFGSALEFLDSLPPGPRAFPTWEENERHLQVAKCGW